MTQPAVGEFRKVHRLTPLLRFWTVILALFAALIFNFNVSTLNSIWGFLSGEFSQAWVSLLIGVGGLMLAFFLVWWVSQIWWKATGFRITDEEVQLKHGVLNTQLRTARYDRVQAVDVVESVIARIFRVAAVRVETAGGGNSVIEIAYLRKAEAEQLREEILAYTRGSAGVASVISDGSVEFREPETDFLVPEIPIQRSLLGALMGIPAIISAAGIIILLLTPVAPASALPVLVGVLPVVWGQIDRSWKFNARLEGEVVHLSYGLADRRRQSIPLHRIHGVKIRQPLLWRIVGWWAVDVTVAGYGQESDKKTGTSKLFPVGSRERAVAVAAVLGPLSLSEIEEYARPEGSSHPQFTSPLIARWVSPIDRKQQGVTLLDQAVIVHKGRLSRQVSMIEPSHIQEVTLSHGPLQQLVNLCTVRMDLVAGPVLMAGEDLNEARGRELVDWLRRRKLPGLETSSSVLND